jgi:lipoprotein-releasing system permease protein
LALPLLLDIALGHLRKRKRQTVVSILGVALGMGFFVAVNALMRGFQQYFVAQVIDVSPHIVVKDEFRLPSPQPAQAAYAGGAVVVSGVKPRAEPRGIRNARARVAEIEAMPGAAVAPTLQGQAILRYGTRDVPIALYGIEPERERRVTNIEADLTAGTLDDLRSTANALIVGVGVADKLGAKLDDTVTVVAPTGLTRSMKITGLLRSGLSSVDNSQGYALLKTVQAIEGRTNIVNQIRIRLADVTQAEPLARRIESRVGYRTESWEESNRNVLGLFVVQNAIMYSVVGAILLVAAFGIYNIISTVVYEKTRDIAILKSLGFARSDIQAIFVAEGVIVGSLGAIAGAVVGWGMVELMGQIRFSNVGGMMSGRNGFILARELWPYLAGAVFALVASTVAALIPARRAARLNPVDIIRGAA